MKRIAIFLPAIALLLSGCRDKYSCQCTTYLNGNAVYWKDYKEINKRKQYKAVVKCDEIGEEQQAGFSDDHNTQCYIYDGVPPVP